MYISDSLYDKNELKSILSDLIIVMNQGGLPSNIFTHKLLSKLKEQSQHFDVFSSSGNNFLSVSNGINNLQANQLSGSVSNNIKLNELCYCESISRNVCRHLHVIISASIETIKSMPVSFKKLYKEH